MPRDYNLDKIRNIGIIAHIDAGKQPPQRGFFFIQEKSTKLVKYTKVKQKWIGWNKKKKEELQLIQLM